MTDKKAMNLALEALKGVYQYGSDTLVGPVKGQPDDRKWQRDGVLEMTKRAYKGIKALEEALAKQEQGEPVGEILLTNGDYKEVSWKNGKLPPVGAKLYTTPPQPKEPEQEMVSKARYNRVRDDYNDLLKQSQQDAKDAKKWRRHVTHCQLQGVDLDHNLAQPEQRSVSEHTGEPVTADEKLARMKSELAYMRGQQEQDGPVSYPENFIDALKFDMALRDFEQGEPLCCNGNCPNTKNCEQAMQCLYTKPQQRKPLTDEQIMELWIDAGWPDAFVQFKKSVRKVEAAHGIKE